MILGMSTATFTAIRVLLSLVGIVSGFVVLWGMLSAKRLDTWTLSHHHGLDELDGLRLSV